MNRLTRRNLLCMGAAAAVAPALPAVASEHMTGTYLKITGGLTPPTGNTLLAFEEMARSMLPVMERVWKEAIIYGQSSCIINGETIRLQNPLAGPDIGYCPSIADLLEPK